MRYRIYKSLDKPSSLFGLRGSYLYYCVVGGVVAAIFAALFGRVVNNSLVGWIVFIALVIVDYFIVMRVQSKLSERERTKWFCSHKLPDYITFQPRRLRTYTTIDFKKKDNKS